MAANLLAATEAIHNAITLTLGQFTAQRRGFQAALAKPHGQALGIAPRGGEDNGLLKFFMAQQVRQQRLLVIQMIAQEKPLADIGMGPGDGIDGNTLGILQQITGQGFHFGMIQRGRKQQRLAQAMIGRRIDLAQLFGKAQIQHAVGFIQHQHLETRQHQGTGVQMVRQTPGGGDNKVRIAPEHLFLVVEVLAALNKHTLELTARQQGSQLAIHLPGQLPRGHQNEHARIPLGKGFALGDPLQGRYQVGQRLAGPRLGGRNQVTIVERKRNRLLLNFSRLTEVQLLKQLEQTFIQGQIGE
jgi:hypothetical protein